MHLSPITAIALLAAVVFAVVGIGTPLVGKGVFAATDQLVARSPYVDAGFAGTPITNAFLDDTYNAELPGELLFGQSIRDGSPALWNPYVSAGTPLGAIPNEGLLSPLALPIYVLPGWLAPAYQKLLETAVAIVGCYLFLRRLRLRRAAALVGGTVFVTSAFMVVWTNWPQTRVAAAIPWVFWAIERLIQRRRLTDAVLLAAAVATMLLGGFPAVTVFTLLTAGPYGLARLVAEYRPLSRRALSLVVGATVAIGGGFALAAVQLLPFSAFYNSWLIEGRAQDGRHLSAADLASSFAPWVFGTVAPNNGEPMWTQDSNIVEASSYVGAAALVLVVVALASARAARALLPRAAWIALVSLAGAWVLLIYLGGPGTALQHLPVFSSNFVGRARSVLGFLLAVLAAIGFEIVLRPRAITARRRMWWRAYGPPIAVGVTAAAATGWLVYLARQTSSIADAARPEPPGTRSRLSFADGELLTGLILLAVSALVVGVLLGLRHRPHLRATGPRVAAAAVLLTLIVGQALTFVGPYWPRVDRSTFYPTTDAHDYLADHLGHDRFVGSAQTMPIGVDAQKQLRALEGHAFIDGNLAALLRAVPNEPVTLGTHIMFTPDVQVATSPVLDRLAGRYFVTSPQDGVFGIPHPPTDVSTLITLAPGVPVSAPVPTTGPVRAVGIVPRTGGLPANASVQVSVADATGRTLATARRQAAGLIPGQVFNIPIAGEAIPPGTPLTATITLFSPVPLAVYGTTPPPTTPPPAPAPKPAPTPAVGPAAGSMSLASISPADDGLRLDYAGSAVIYRRLDALPRIRWASQAVVLPDPSARVAALASGTLSPDQVVLNGPGPIAAGQPATVSVVTDGLNRITTTVNAAGSGYLVVADALQTGWSATVDGQPAPLVPADEAVVAVPVGAGEHRVELRYDPPYHGLGTWLSGAALLTAIALVLADQWWLARRRRRRPGTQREAAARIGGPHRS